MVVKANVAMDTFTIPNGGELGFSKKLALAVLICYNPFNRSCGESKNRDDNCAFCEQ